MAAWDEVQRSCPRGVDVNRLVRNDSKVRRHGVAPSICMTASGECMFTDTRFDECAAATLQVAAHLPVSRRLPCKGGLCRGHTLL